MYMKKKKRMNLGATTKKSVNEYMKKSRTVPQVMKGGGVQVEGPERRAMHQPSTCSNNVKMRMLCAGPINGFFSVLVVRRCCVCRSLVCACVLCANAG